MVNFCETCGFQIASSSAGFCGNCGSSINPGPSNEAALAEEVGESIQSGNKGVPGAYRLSKWKGWLTGLFSAQALILFIGATAFLSRRSLILDPRSSMRELVDADESVEMVMNGLLWVVLATFVILIMWSWRVAKNTHLWATPRHSTGWAIGGWFCPIANFFVPYRILHDGWRLTPNSGSKRYDPVGGPTEQVTNQKLTPLLIGWIAWWTGHLVARVGSSGNPESLKGLADQEAWAAAGFFIIAAASVFLIIAIRRISHRHDKFANL